MNKLKIAFLVCFSLSFALWLVDVSHGYYIIPLHWIPEYIGILILAYSASINHSKAATIYLLLITFTLPFSVGVLLNDLIYCVTVAIPIFLSSCVIGWGFGRWMR